MVIVSTVYLYARESDAHAWWIVGYDRYWASVSTGWQVVELTYPDMVKLSMGNPSLGHIVDSKGTKAAAFQAKIQKLVMAQDKAKLA